MSSQCSRDASGTPGTGADDERTQQVGQTHSTGEVSEQNQNTGSGGDGGKGSGQGESEPAKRAPDSEPDQQAQRVGSDATNGNIEQGCKLHRSGPPRLPDSGTHCARKLRGLGLPGSGQRSRDAFQPFLDEPHHAPVLYPMLDEPDDNVGYVPRLLLWVAARRSQHKAPDALRCGLNERRVNRVLDLGVRSFSNAGMLEEHMRTQVEAGLPQGGRVSPLLANIYLRYVFDLWVQAWRRTRGPVKGRSRRSQPRTKQAFQVSFRRWAVESGQRNHLRI